MGSKLRALILCLAVAPALRSDACGLFAGRGFSDLTSLPVSIREEETLIVWDADRKRQDFIRKVAFNASVPQFGLLVPVPSRPEVAEADTSLFDELRGEMEDQRPRRTEYIWWPRRHDFDGALGSAGGGMAPPGSRSKGGVQVVEEVQVGLFKAQVLTASDAGELQTWLEAQGFSMGAGASEYLTHYTGGSWHWVALSYVSEASGSASPEGPRQDVASQTFRLSFDTPEAFYPYREPKRPELSSDAPLDISEAAPRTLRLYVLAAEKVSARTRGQAGEEAEWPRPEASSSYQETIFRAPLRKRSEKLAQLVPSLPANAQLSAFVETLYPALKDTGFSSRPDADLFLRFDASLQEKLLEERVTVVDLSAYVIIVLELMIVGLVGWGLWRLIARRRRKV
jgi:hypothetical protein